jgi:AraC-like DNA-binding protein
MPGHDGPIDAATDRLHRRILGRIEQNVEPLQVEELGLALASRVIAAASRLRLGRPPRRRDTARVHAGVVGDVKGLLAAHLGERLSLMQIADSVHVAPNHLCTVFRWQTGFSIHRYLIRLRLAAVRERMADQRDTLADLATEFGFAHQSHLTAAFRREFGATPARLRRGLPAVPSDS